MIAVGDRVKITAELIGVELASPLGTVEADDHDGYWVIALDIAGWHTEQGVIVPYVVEHEDNFEVVR